MKLNAERTRVRRRLVQNSLICMQKQTKNVYHRANEFQMESQLHYFEMSYW